MAKITEKILEKSIRNTKSDLKKVKAKKKEFAKKKDTHTAPTLDRMLEDSEKDLVRNKKKIMESACEVFSIF